MSEQKRYVKNPVTIEALLWDGTNVLAMQEFAGDAFEPDYSDKAEGYCVIKTLEGEHLASPGDYVIKGIKGEFYPCKPDIFALTYYPAPPSTTEKGGE